MSSLSLADQLDRSIEVLMAKRKPNGKLPHDDRSMSELLGIATELRLFPRPEFKAHLKADLLGQALAMSSVSTRVNVRVPARTLEIPKRGREQAAQSDVLPTLFGVGYGNYPVRRSNFVMSLLAHAAVVALAVGLSVWAAGHPKEVTHRIVTDISPYTPPPGIYQSGGGGGGGARDVLSASKGKLPLAAREQITPPTVVVRNLEPKLSIAPTVVAPPSLTLPQPQLGDPLAAVLSPPSSGTGAGSGIGSGTGTGVGGGQGPGVGTGWGGGMGGGAYRIGGGVSAPRAIYAPDPEYSEEARKAKYQGTVTLWVVVGPDGLTKDLRVMRSLGLGLDEKAMEAVRNWRFEPAMKDRRPVAVQLNIEVSFRLY